MNVKKTKSSKKIVLKITMSMTLMWAVDPAKLAKFSVKKMVPKVAEAYGTNLVKKEIPLGLKHYLELKLFPRIHMKAIRGVSLSTARRWLHRKGFRFTEHRKSLYFDGHE